MDKEMTYMKFMELLTKVRQEADTDEQAFENTDKLLYNILDKNEIIDLVL